MHGASQMTRPLSRLALLAALAILGVTPRMLRAQDAPSLGAGAVTSQLLLGVIGTAGGFIGGGLVTRSVATRSGADEYRASNLAYIGAYVGAALATPVGPMLIGNRGRATGSYVQGLAGTLVGGLGSALLKTLGDRGAFDCRACGVVRIVAGIGIVMLPSVGATVGFDRSRERER